VSPWDGPRTVSSWLHAGKNSRASHSKMKVVLLNNIHATDRMRSVSESERPWEKHIPQNVGHLRK